MGTFFIGLIVGLFIGAAVGLFAASLCIMAKDADNKEMEDK